MVNDAQVFLAGYVATEPTFKRVADGISSAKLRVAYTARRLNRETGEWTDGPTSFVGVQCWRGLAENVAMCLRKGEPVLVRGRLQVRRYENSEGAPRVAVEVDATAVGHDLNRGVAHFSRTRRSTGETAAGSAEVLAAGGRQGGDGPAPDEPPESADGAGDAAAIAAAADGVVDERAVEQFARELDESLSADGEVSVSI
jgi:single-strand DNA-binding protein